MSEGVVDVLFNVTIGFNTESATYGALVSNCDGQYASLEHAELRSLLWRLRELLLTKAGEIQSLPPEADSLTGTIKIETPADFRPPLVGADGKVLNGHS